MIQRCRTMFPLRLMCRLLQVSPSGFYARQRRSASPLAQDGQRLTAAIRTLHAESDGVYGSPKIWQILRKQGEGCGKHRIARLMRREGLRGIPAPKRWKRRTSGERPAGITNQLARDFTAPIPNTKWVTDITYIPTQEGWLYLAVVLDLFSRQVIGWSMQPYLGRDLVMQAVLMAVWQRRNSKTVILHSDRGTQYTAQEFQAFLQAHGIVSSMSGVGNCYDNAVAESFFGLLKRERVHRRQYATRAEARTDVFDYIERFYNHRRSHSFTQGLAPRNFVEQYDQQSSLTCP
ncbi:MAG: transposase [Nitrospirales bacterium]|nr:MAG: transposase [Nitrospirales bacterium]